MQGKDFSAFRRQQSVASRALVPPRAIMPYYAKLVSAYSLALSRMSARCRTLLLMARVACQ